MDRVWLLGITKRENQLRELNTRKGRKSRELLYVFLLPILTAFVQNRPQGSDTQK
jgi:hypothetical protein